MRRTSMVVATALVAASLLVACSPRVPVTTIATVDTGARCMATLEEGNVSNWKEVQSEGFTFCVPQNWKLDAQFQRLQSVQRSQIFRRVSWASPDSTQRIFIDIPTDKGLPTQALQSAITWCGPQYLVKIGEGRGCISYPNEPATVPTCGRCASAITVSPNKSTIPTSTYLDFPKLPVTGSAVRVVISDPLIQVRAIGNAGAWRVIETVRPISTSNENQ